MHLTDWKFWLSVIIVIVVVNAAIKPNVPASLAVYL